MGRPPAFCPGLLPAIDDYDHRRDDAAAGVF